MRGFRVSFKRESPYSLKAAMPRCFNGLKPFFGNIFFGSIFFSSKKEN